MTSEERHVVVPLVKWFRNHKRSGAHWDAEKTKFGTGERGWDIEARRKNQYLLIEAKYLKGPFLSSLNGMVTAPLANRPQRFFRIRQYRSWSFGICWAIGSNTYSHENIYQILFDYFGRNELFWEHYAQDLRIKYIFFVFNKKVSKVSFIRMLRLAKKYKKYVGDKKLAERRRFAGSMMEKIINLN